MIVSRISAKIGDGKLILLHMEGELYFFTFGKSEVSKISLVINFFDLLGVLGFLSEITCIIRIFCRV